MSEQELVSHGHDELDYNYITDGIYIGNNQCCQLRFSDELIAQGINTDISFEEERMDAPFGVSYYVWIPVKNFEAPTMEQLEFAVSIMEKNVMMKKKIYAHCQKGHGRAPTFVAAYLINGGKTFEEAELFIKQRRPSIHIEDVQKAVLREFAESLLQR